MQLILGEVNRHLFHHNITLNPLIGCLPFDQKFWEVSGNFC